MPAPEVQAVHSASKGEGIPSKGGGHSLTLKEARREHKQSLWGLLRISELIQFPNMCL